MHGLSDGEEEAWVMAAKAGDLLCFDNLVKRYRPGAVLLARQIVGSVDGAEDAAQDALLAAYKALPQLADASKFAGWLGAIVRNRARKTLRSPERGQLTLDALILEHTPSMALRSELSWESDLVRAAVRRLEDELRVVSELYYFEGWPVARISEFLLVSATTVKWRLHTSRKCLKRSLAGLLEEENEDE